MGRIDVEKENAAIRAELEALVREEESREKNDEKEDGSEKAKRYLKVPCSGCGGRVEVTSPQTHVVSTYTGATYCGTCTIHGLPPIDQRPEFNPVKADLIAREGIIERSKRMSATETTNDESTPVFDELIERVKAEIPGVTLDPRKGYVTLKVDGKTIGYVNGKKKIRIDGIVVEGNQEKQTLTESSQIGAGLDLLKRNAALIATRAAARAEAAKAKPKAEKKPAAKKPAAKASANGETSSDVKPDPKPTRKRNPRPKAEAKS